MWLAVTVLATLLAVAALAAVPAHVGIRKPVVVVLKLRPAGETSASGLVDRPVAWWYVIGGGHRVEGARRLAAGPDGK